MSELAGSLLLRISTPHGRQTYFGNRVPLEAWCVSVNKDEELLSSLDESCLTCCMTIGSEPDSDELHSSALFGSSGVKIFPESGGRKALEVSLKEISFSAGNNSYVSESGKDYGRVLHIRGVLELPMNIAREQRCSVFLSLVRDNILVISNPAVFFLGTAGTFDEAVRGGLEHAIPARIYYPRILLSSWGFEAGSKIVSVGIQADDPRYISGDISGNACSHVTTRTVIGLEGGACSQMFPDFPEAKCCGADTMLDFGKEGLDFKRDGLDFANEGRSVFKNLSFYLAIESETGKSIKQFIGNSRIVFDKFSHKITSVKSEESEVVIEGMLLCDHLPEERFFIRYMRGGELESVDHYISFFRTPTDPQAFGAITDRLNPRFRLSLPYEKIPIVFSGFMLFLESGGKRLPLLTPSDVSIVKSLIARGHTETLGKIPLYKKQYFIFKKVIKRLKKLLAGGVPGQVSSSPDDNKVGTSGRPDRESIFSISFFSHNLERSEGAPAVFAKLLKVFPEISNYTSEQILLNSFRDGSLGETLKEHVGSLTVIETGSMISQTEERYFKTLSEIRRNLRASNTNLVFVNCLDSFVAVDAAIRENIPVVWLVHESVDPHTWYFGYDYRLRIHCLHALKHANKLVFVSESTRAMYLPFVQEKSTCVIPNSIDGASFYESVLSVDKEHVRGSLGISRDSLVLLSVGTTTERKGQDRTLRELALLKAERPSLDFVFLVVGAREIPFLEKLKKQCSELGLDSHVKFIRETPEVIKYYALADIFIINSREESFPLVTLEAFSAKVPLVSTEVFGLKEIIQHEENALSFDGDDEGALCRALIRLIDEKDLGKHLSANAFTMLLEKYDDRKWKSGFSELVEYILSRDILS